MANMVRVTLNKDVESLLESLKRDYPALDYSEILKLGLSELYRKRELERRRAWEESLPTLELSAEEQESLDEALGEVERGEGRPLSIEEVMTELKS